CSLCLRGECVCCTSLDHHGETETTEVSASGGARVNRSSSLFWGNNHRVSTISVQPFCGRLVGRGNFQKPRTSPNAKDHVGAYSSFRKEVSKRLHDFAVNSQLRSRRNHLCGEFSRGDVGYAVSEAIDVNYPGRNFAVSRCPRLKRRQPNVISDLRSQFLRFDAF